ALAPDRDASVELSVPAGDDVASGIEVLLRLAPLRDGRFSTPSLAITSPSGERVSLGALDLGGVVEPEPSRDCARHEPIDCWPDGRPPDVARTLADGGEVRLFRPVSADADGARWWTLSLVGGGDRSLLAHGRYPLEVRGEGRLDLVIIRAERQGAWRSPLWLDGPDSRPETALVGFPGAAAGVVSVGAVVSREGAGIVPGTPMEPVSWPPARASFSSAGPSFDARPEPDVVAPGRWVTTALASGSRYATDPVYATYRHDDRIALAGTSMSAPLVAGALALVLARHPDLDADDLAALVRASARGATSPGAAFDPELGAGVLAVAALLDAADAHRAGETTAADPRASSASVTRDTVDCLAPATQVVVRPRDATGRPARAEVRVSASHGRVGMPERDPTGRVVVPVALDAVAGPRRVRISVELDGIALAPLQVERSGADGARARGGGCSAGGYAASEPGRSAWLRVAIALALLVGARRGRPRLARARARGPRVPAWPNATPRSPPPSA
ncbi:MAG: S8 family serine peptidase, partial [Deltaproteobacteria bacterium]|nr:S8 family serine peptidase [Deltaproteobacteria bacterium]